MGTTNVYGWRYPEVGDQPNGPAEIQQVAEDIEGTVAGIDTGKVPADRIDWVNVTPISPVTIRNRLRIMRHSTGQVEFQVSINVPTGTTSIDVCTLPSWAWVNGATYILTLATNNTASTKVYMNIATDGAVSLAMSSVTSGAPFVEGVVCYTP